MKPLPAIVCPLCGNPNGCAPAENGHFDVPCWCGDATIAPDVFARMPPAQRGKACLCRACAQGAAQADEPGSNV